MQKGPDGQFELVLENRQVLTIFFAVVVLCGVFFALGFTVGKNTIGYIAPSDPTVVAAAGKKSAITPSEIQKEEPAAASAPAITYDKSLPQAAASAPKLETAPPAAVAADEPTISLQVAALSKKEDAEALLSLLSRKGFRAYSTSNSADRLVRVQVGPFGHVKDAEDAKTRLEQEGFRPITKR